jgi:hypothetical protein
MCSMENTVQERRSPSWVQGPDLWRVGFHIGSLSIIRLLSGLVDIHDVLWLNNQQAIFFVVTNKDATNVLFKTGALQASRIPAFRPTGQPILVEHNVGQVPPGGN